MSRSLTSCKSCNLQIAMPASACPGCGEALRTGTLATLGFWILATPFFLLTLPVFVEGFSKGADFVSPEQVQARRESEARFKAAWTRVAAIKSISSDPGSFALESVHVTRADVVCIEYRARNGMGGMNRESIIVDGAQPYQSTDDDGNYSGKWNELCAAEDSWNFTERVKNSL